MIKKVLIATFSFYQNKKRSAINGMVEPLLSFFLPNTEILDMIDGYHPGSETPITKFEHYKQKKLTSQQTSIVSFILYPLLWIQNKDGTQLSFKIRDFLSVFELPLRTKTRYDLFIGIESMYTIAGIILKKLGLVKSVIYYVSDFSPDRYRYGWLNIIYVALDRLCCCHADYIWDVSKAMHPARIKAGLNEKKSAPVIIVPNALFDEQITYLEKEKLEPFSIVFAGTFGPENGPQIAIEAMRDVLKKVPSAKLHLFGGDEILEENLKKVVQDLNLSEAVVFHGFISDATELSKEIRKYMIGVAPYASFPDSPRWYADATKLRLYMGAGLPIITTQVPPLGKEIEAKKAGIIKKDDSSELAKGILQLFSNQKLYDTLRKNAIEFAKHNTWRNSYGNALKQMSL